MWLVGGGWVVKIRIFQLDSGMGLRVRASGTLEQAGAYSSGQHLH